VRVDEGFSALSRLGWLHERRSFAECAIVAIRFMKHEIIEWRDYFRRLKRELTAVEVGPLRIYAVVTISSQ